MAKILAFFFFLNKTSFFLKRVKILKENEVVEDVTQKVEFNIKQSVDIRVYEGFCFVCLFASNLVKYFKF
jgi:hypothetical protein